MPSCFARLVTLVGHARARNFILGSGILIALLVAAATCWVVTDLRADQIGHEKHELRNLSIALAEQIDRSLQGVDFLQHNLVDRTRELGVSSSDALRSQMGTYETHRYLANRVARFPLVANFCVYDVNGRLAIPHTPGRYQTSTFTIGTSSPRCLPRMHRRHLSANRTRARPRANGRSTSAAE